MNYHNIYFTDHMINFFDIFVILLSLHKGGLDSFLLQIFYTAMVVPATARTARKKGSSVTYNECSRTRIRRSVPLMWTTSSPWKVPGRRGSAAVRRRRMQRGHGSCLAGRTASSTSSAAMIKKFTCSSREPITMYTLGKINSVLNTRHYSWFRGVISTGT